MSKGVPRRAQTFVFLGLSGSGKGTQAERLARALPRGRIVSTGDGLRHVAKGENFVGRYIARILRQGGLVPYWGPSHIWLVDFFAHLTGNENLVSEGSPRRIKEAQMLDDFMRDVGRPLPRAIYLKLSPGAARVRLLARGRHDDNPRAIAGRFDFFRTYVHPVVRYYRKRRRLIEINGDQDVPAVWRDVKSALKIR